MLSQHRAHLTTTCCLRDFPEVRGAEDFRLHPAHFQEATECFSLQVLLSQHFPYSLVSDVEPRPHFVGMVTRRLARVEEPLQLGHARDRGGALAVLSVRGPGAAPGPGEPGHERHLS